MWLCIASALVVLAFLAFLAVVVVSPLLSSLLFTLSLGRSCSLHAHQAAAGASNYTGSLEVHTETQAAELMRHLVRRWFNRMRAEADAEKTAAAGRKKPHAHGGSAH